MSDNANWLNRSMLSQDTIKHVALARGEVHAKKRTYSNACKKFISDLIEYSLKGTSRIGNNMYTGEPEQDIQIDELYTKWRKNSLEKMIVKAFRDKDTNKASVLMALYLEDNAFRVDYPDYTGNEYYDDLPDFDLFQEYALDAMRKGLKLTTMNLKLKSIGL